MVVTHDELRRAMHSNSTTKSTRYRPKPPHRGARPATDRSSGLAAADDGTVDDRREPGLVSATNPRRKDAPP